MQARAGAQPSAEDLAALRGALGDEAVLEHAVVEVDGCPLGATLRPATGESLAAALAMLSERGLSVLVRGSGTALSLGNPPLDAGLFLSTEALAGVDDFDAEDGVAHVLAGTRLAELRRQVEPHGWELPLDPPGEERTLGGTLASAALGPRRLGFGAARDCVLGLEVALASGVRTRCGGRVVKNVTGYDLSKLYTGSFGTLGVIEAAWVRLHPLPACVMERAAPVEAGSEAFELGLAASRRPAARVAALLTPRLARRLSPELVFDSQWLLVSEFAGDADTSRDDAIWLERLAGASTSSHGDGGASCEPGELTAGLRGLQGALPEGLRARIAVLPSALEQSCAPLLEAGAELLVYPGLGLIYASFGLDAQPGEPEAGSLDAALAAVERAVERGNGSWVLEELPARAKPGREVFGVAAATLSLMRVLKGRFDPRGVLNRGRFCGGI